jgi:hypothetical protein
LIFKTVLWIRIGFIVDLDPAFYLNVDADPQHCFKISQTLVSGPGQR